MQCFPEFRLVLTPQYQWSGVSESGKDACGREPNAIKKNLTADAIEVRERLDLALVRQAAQPVACAQRASDSLFRKYEEQRDATLVRGGEGPVGDWTQLG